MAGLGWFRVLAAAVEALAHTPILSPSLHFTQWSFTACHATSNRGGYAYAWHEQIMF